MLSPQESTKRSAVCPTGDEEISDVTMSVASSFRPDQATNDKRLPICMKLRGDVTWWAMVPKPFLFLIAFCVGFALVSLMTLLVMATDRNNSDSHASKKTSARDDKAVSSGMLLAIGVVSSIVGSLQTATGYCAQRLSHQLTDVFHRRQRAKAPESTPKHHPLFHIGLLLLVCGTISAVVNLGILGQSVTAPFAAMTLIFNGCLAFTVLHEAVTKCDVLATVLVLLGVGVAMVGVSIACLDDQTFTLADMETIFTRSLLPILYSVTILGSLVASFVVVKKRRLQNKWPGLCCFAVGAGVLSGFSSLCVKCTVEVLKSVSQHHSNDLSNPILYLFVAGIPICVLSQLKLMTLGLKHFGTLKFVPPYHAFIIMSNLINGMIYFDEARGYDALSAALFVVGCAITIGGVLVLLAKVPPATEDGTVKSPVKCKATEVSQDEMTSTSSSSEGVQDTTVVQCLDAVVMDSTKPSDSLDSNV